METLFDQYKELNINGSLICLEQVEDIYSYLCYPTNAKAIGFEGSIMYCFIEPYGEMVFACNPDTCADVFVYPLARTFDVFKMKIRSGSIRRLYWWDFRGALHFYNLFPPCCISFLSPVPQKARAASLRLHW